MKRLLLFPLVIALTSCGYVLNKPWDAAVEKSWDGSYKSMEDAGTACYDWILITRDEGSTDRFECVEELATKQVMGKKNGAVQIRFRF